MIAEILDTSTIDFPGRVCSVIFFARCNFRCPYCHNWRLLTADAKYSIEDAISRVQSNFLVDSICISGGEPTLHREELKNLINLANAEEFAVKVDTNGSNPEVVKSIEDKVDYFAIDFKTSKKKYSMLTSISDAYERLLETISIVKEKAEIRTTVVPEIVAIDDLLEIAKVLCRLDVHNWYLQQYRNDDVLDPRFRSIKPYEESELFRFKEEIEERFSLDVEVRK